MAEADKIVDGSKVAVVGRIEYLHNGAYGTTCDDNASPETAEVFCRSVDLPYENAELIYEYGGGVGEVLFGNVRCKGTESEIKLCPRYQLIGIGSVCSHREDLGVKCL